MVSNKFKRDFTSTGALKRPGRFDPIVLQDILNAGDGHPGLQRVIKNLICSFYGRYIVEGCTYDGTTLTSGFIMWDSDVVTVSEQAQGLANGEFLYLDGDGVAQVTAVEATALAGIIVSYRTGGGVLEHIATKFEDNELDVYSFVVNHNLTVEGDADLNGDLDVDGITNLDVTDIDDTLDVSGIVDFHSALDMNNQDIQKIKDIDVDGIVDIEGATDINSTLDIHGDLDVHNTNIDDVASIDGGGNAVQFDDDINLPSNNITLGAAQTVDGVNISAIALNNMPAAAGGNIDCNAQAITNVGNVDSVDVSSIKLNSMPSVANGDISCNAQNITSVGNVDGVDISAIKLNSMPSAATGNVDVNTNKIINLTNGAGAQDAMAFGQKTIASELNLNDLNEKSYNNLTDKPVLRDTFGLDIVDLVDFVVESHYYKVLNSEASGSISGYIKCPFTRNDWKICISFHNDVASKVGSGLLMVGAYAVGEEANYTDIFNTVNFDLSNTIVDLRNDKYSEVFTANKDDMIGFSWYKDGNEGTEALYIESVDLVY